MTALVLTRPLRWFLPVALLLGLVACGPPRKSVFPPTVTIQQMQVQPNGTWQLTVRIQNNSYGEMDFSSLDGEFKVAALIPVRLHETFQRDIPAFAGDVITLDVLPTVPMAAALQAVAAKGSAGSLAYSISDTARARRDWDQLASVPAVANGRVHILGDQLFVSPGPRLGEALDRLVTIIWSR